MKRAHEWLVKEDGGGLGIQTGWSLLDKCTGGLYPGQLWVFSACADNGRCHLPPSLLASQLLLEVVSRPAAAPCLLISSAHSAAVAAQELSKIYGSMRMLAAENLKTSLPEFADLPLFIDAASVYGVDELTDVVVRGTSEHGVRVVLIDDWNGLIGPTGGQPASRNEPICSDGMALHDFLISRAKQVRSVACARGCDSTGITLLTVIHTPLPVGPLGYGMADAEPVWWLRQPEHPMVAFSDVHIRLRTDTGQNKSVAGSVSLKGRIVVEKNRNGRSNCSFGVCCRTPAMVPPGETIPVFVEDSFITDDMIPRADIDGSQP